MRSDVVSDELTAMRARIAGRFGIVPSFFLTAAEVPQIADGMFGLAELAFLDSPFPALFKERLFAYVSRFCAEPYCMALHCGFLLGYGNVAGDPDASRVSADAALAMLRVPFPNADARAELLLRLSEVVEPIVDFPEPGDPLENTIFFAAAVAFLRPIENRPLLAELRRVLGNGRYHHLSLFLSFIRFAHHWTEMHPELRLDADLEQLFGDQLALADWMGRYKESVSSELAYRDASEVRQLASLRARAEERARAAEADRAALRAVVAEQARSANMALQTSQARLSVVADLVPDLIWESEVDGAACWHNARWSEYTGQTSEQAHGLGWTDVVHPEDRARALAHYVRASARGALLDHELRIRRFDNTYRWFLVRAEPLRDDAGRIVRWFGAATNIHAQRLALGEAEQVAQDRAAERDMLRRQLAEAEESERGRLARELHDQLGQELTAIGLGLEDALRLATAHGGMLASPDTPLFRRLSQLRALAADMTAGARYLALELRPPELDDVGLESAIETYVREWSARYEVAADVAIAGPRRSQIAPDVASALYRIAQEALTNVAKHARATSVSVILERRAREVSLVIEDNGRGFDPEEVAVRARLERRLGLAGMRERAALVGGTVTVEARPGVGTTVYVRLTVDSEKGRSL